MLRSGESLKFGTYVGVGTAVSVGLFFLTKMRKRKSQANQPSSGDYGATPRGGMVTQ